MEVLFVANLASRRKGKNMRAPITLLLAMAFVSFLLGISSSAVRAQADPAHITPALEARIKRLENRLMAPCCYTQTIREHQSQEAEEMREEVTAMVFAGKSEQEIISYYRSKYGETILVVPDGMSGRLLTFTPILIFVASTGLLFVYFRRSARPRPAATDPAQPEESSLEFQRFRETIRAESGENL